MLSHWGLRSSIREREAPIVGFCFSFPVQQTAVDAGRLLRWTKGFENPGAVGKDPAILLADAFRRKVLHGSDPPLSCECTWQTRPACNPVTPSAQQQPNTLRHGTPRRVLVADNERTHHLDMANFPMLKHLRSE